MFELPRHQTHRGYWKGGVQENTLQAFRLAAKMGSKMCECDVRLSCDGIPVVFHDENPPRNAPTLEEVLSDTAATPYLNLELKSSSHFHGALERKVAEVVKRTQSEKRIIVSSFDPVALWKISRLLPDVPRALLVLSRQDKENPWHHLLLLTAPFLRLQFLHLDHRMVNEKSMSFWRWWNIPIVVWTANDRATIGKYLEMGVSSVISDEIFPEFL